MGFDLPCSLRILQTLAIGFLPPPHHRQLVSRSQELNKGCFIVLSLPCLLAISDPVPAPLVMCSPGVPPTPLATPPQHPLASPPLFSALYLEALLRALSWSSSHSTLSPGNLIHSLSFGNHPPRCQSLSCCHTLNPGFPG